MKILKWAGVAAGLVLLLFAAVMVVVFLLLPSPAEIGHKLYMQPPAPSAPPAFSEDGSSAEPAVSATGAAPAVETPPAPAPVAVGTLDSKRSRDREILRKLMDPSRPLTKFCDHLGEPSTASRKINVREFGEKMIAHFSDARVSDPAMEAAAPVLKQIFVYPEIQSILNEAERAAEDGDAGFMRKAGFYSMVYSAAQRLRAEKTNLEKLSDRSYHFFMMARAMDLRPELRNDRAVMDYCRQIERSMNARQPFGEDDERRGFQEFLDQIRVRPEEIGYDPGYRTRLNVKVGDGSLTFDGGWMDEWLRPSPKAVQR